MSRSADPQLARYWQERLDRFEHSDLTISEFCQMEGYSTASFYQWRRKLQGGSRRGGPAFIPVDHASTVVEPHTGSQNLKGTRRGSGPLDGFSLRSDFFGTRLA